MKAKAVKLAYKRTLPFITLIKQSIASYRFITAFPSVIKTYSLLPSLKVHFFDL